MRPARTRAGRGRQAKRARPGQGAGANGRDGSWRDSWAVSRESRTGRQADHEGKAGAGRPRDRPCGGILGRMSLLSPAGAYVLANPATFALKVLKGFTANQGLLLAGAVAYYALLSVVP